uniref:Disease resistance protein At4g27190-like leucine-rich repeats domain-containing protein n=1 Tax=Oryza nivara TaxID=4536 RepID=A0A0E0H081_ORYNI
MRLEAQLVAAVAQELGLLDQVYHRLKQRMEETNYFSWGVSGDNEMREYLFWEMAPRINATLDSKRYLLVVENLYKPITTSAFTTELRLPPANAWSGSEWVVSATSREVCSKSKSEDDGVYESFSGADIMVLILFALHQSAKDISKAVGQEDDLEHWHRVALRCFHYALLLFPQWHEPPTADNNNGINVTKEELIRHWAAQGFLTASKPPRAVQDNIHNVGIRHHDDVYQVGNIILQTFLEYSLLKLPSAPATKVDEPTDTAAHFLAYHGLVINHLTEDEMFHEEQCLQNMGWIKLLNINIFPCDIFQDMIKLEELLLSMCSNLEELPRSISALSSLLTLEISGTKLTSLPDWMFIEMQQLQLLKLIENKLLVSVPSFNINTRRLVEYVEFFQDFYVQIAQCKTNIRRLEDEQDMMADKLTELANKKSPYGDVYRRYMAKEFSVVAIAPPIRQTKRHVEMSATNRYPHGLYSLLQVAKSISLIDDIYVSCLTKLSSFDKLEDCKLRSCHHMKHVLEYAYSMGQSLQNVRVSQLQSLIHFYKPLEYNDTSNFDSLKHLHLEYCPRLERIVPRESALPSLTTLDILFCYNLKTIFYQHPCEQPINYQLPSLQRMRLQELPLLQHLRDDVNAAISAPAWKELHVRGCWSLRRLPLLRQEHSSQAVEVSGERAWWRKLIWDDDSSTMHSASYKSKLPLPFASFNERATVMSYLR